MRLFHCECCGQRLYFENTHCVHCDTPQGFDPYTLSLRSMTSDAFRPCINRESGICNWLVPAQSDDQYCLSCRMTLVIPDLSVSGNVTLWADMEAEKQRLIYSLFRLHLPLVTRQLDPDNGLGFRFMADAPLGDSERIMTGHLDGVITLNLAEADPVVREATRRQMAEPYRTILGHFRHEVGHYYWQQLISNGDWQEDFRRRFGDERDNYAQALQRHYQQGPRQGWQQHYISAYASSHPWEDWAETWAHYLHMVDTLETAYEYGLTTMPRGSATSSAEVNLHDDPYQKLSFDQLIAQWLPLTTTMNSLNHSMGYDDVYPFNLSTTVIDKLSMVHSVIHQHSNGI
ncbi:hypothetical protein BGP77_12165 [Saccharospirillum sp. MSK14-1]|uniref:zinc-binding metallopeptidase family protein n=1 Tax=Saccharospirillum sp. MSK14-1 TaxID=1897632 RepID=UPI000D3D7106|nr:putative zinc-binding metallopeptidase [Saccharospirillum sp. MSK14-1]PTY38458.1 hypothetical protein BGP77_12165 [Saccharospirillum sp. MSK14-1]